MFWHLWLIINFAKESTDLLGKLTFKLALVGSK